MSDIEPIAVVLKFGFLAVLYLFLFWVTRTALRELRTTSDPGLETGYHEVVGSKPSSPDAWLVVVKAKGLKRGDRYDLFGGLSIGRSDEAEIRISDKFASSLHARIYSRAGSWIVQDLDSTNGTLLNGEELRGESEALDGDVIEIGDTKFRIELG